MKIINNHPERVAKKKVIFGVKEGSNFVKVSFFYPTERNQNKKKEFAE